jgi:hypothetical protein
MGKTPQNELSFKIDAYTPDTLPLSVFAEYITELAGVLGDPHDVSFVRVGKGSVRLVQKVKQHAISAVKERIASLKSGAAQADVQAAFGKVNTLLRRDNAIGTLSMGGAKLIEFPGRKQKIEPPIGPVIQPDYIDGQLIRAGGKDDTVPIHIRDEDGIIHICTANITIATELGPHLYRGSIRVFGTGHWYRQADGEWTLDFFRIESFNALDDRPLSDVVSDLRKVDTSEWPPDVPVTLAALRTDE